MDTTHAFSNYVKATLNHGLSLSEVDWGDPKGESTKYGPMLMEVDWGGKLMVNHSSECMLSEVDCAAHETHPNGHSITEVDWGCHDPCLYLVDGCMLSEVDWGAHDSSPNHITSECMLSEVHWGAHDSSFFLYLK